MELTLHLNLKGRLSEYPLSGHSDSLLWEELVTLGGVAPRLTSRSILEVFALGYRFELLNECGVCL